MQADTIQQEIRERRLAHFFQHATGPDPPSQPSGTQEGATQRKPQQPADIRHNKARSRAWKKKKRAEARRPVQDGPDQQHAGEGEAGDGVGGQVVEGEIGDGTLLSEIVGMVPDDWSGDAIEEEEGELVERDPTPVPE